MCRKKERERERDFFESLPFSSVDMETDMWRKAVELWFPKLILDVLSLIF